MIDHQVRGGDPHDRGGLAALRSAPAVEVSLAKLSVGYSPRELPVDDGHVRLLMEVLDHLPPILVHQETMTVIDGVHRVEAFRRAGRTRISAFVFRGDRCAALALAVEANVRHGKPLSQAERRAAAAAILSQAPERSDRWVGETCGISHSTVSRLRAEMPGPVSTSGPTIRVGRDGRRRPVEPGAARSQVAKVMAEQPDSTLRDAAEAAGVSASTAHAIASQRRGQARTGAGPRPPTGAGGRERTEVGSDVPIVEDPALRSSPELVEFAGWLDRTGIMTEDIVPYLGALPLSRVYALADEFRRRSKAWAAMADAVEYGPHGPALRSVRP